MTVRGVQSLVGPRLVGRRAIPGNKSVPLSAAPDGERLERNDATGELHVDLRALDPLYQWVIDRGPLATADPPRRKSSHPLRKLERWTSSATSHRHRSCSPTRLRSEGGKPDCTSPTSST